MKLSALALGAMLSVSALVGVAYAENPMVGGAAMFEDKNIIENAVNSADHTTLVAAVQAAGLVETLSGKGPFTVFAPTDEAFAKLPAGTVEALLKDKAKLASILTYHVVSGDVRAAQAMKLSTAKTVNGQSLGIAVKDGSVMINNAKVVKADIVTTNGVIHVIDTVVLPK